MGILDKLTGRPPAEVDVRGLFEKDVADLKDHRNLNENQALTKAIMEYQSPNNVEKAEIFTFDSEMRKTPDFYLPYYWAATYHFDKGNFEEAKKILLDGIKNSNIKSVLCRRLGEYYLQQGDVDHALYWLFTAVLADTGHIDYHVYLYIAYIAEVYGLRRITSWALRRSRGISYKVMLEAAEYSTKKKERIQGIAETHKNDRIGSKLEAFYDYAKPRLKDI